MKARTAATTASRSSPSFSEATFNHGVDSRCDSLEHGFGKVLSLYVVWLVHSAPSQSRSASEAASTEPASVSPGLAVGGFSALRILMMVLLLLVGLQVWERQGRRVRWVTRGPAAA
jgi:hypothetical protein